MMRLHCQQQKTMLFGGLLLLFGLSACNEPLVGLEPMFDEISLEHPVALIAGPMLENGSEPVWFVVEQSGRILRLTGQGKSVQSRVFVDLRDRVEDGPNEAGLLGMAFDPQFKTNKRVYLSYTRHGSPLVSVLSRFVSIDGGRVLDLNSEQVLLQVPQPYGNHNGGDVHFGPDGYLYFGLGDGGSSGDPKGNGQSKHTLLGSLLRLDVRGDKGYQIPADNPFAGGGGRPEIYAYGLRNPWRWSFDRTTGELWLGDVGQNTWEEVNVITRGGNYGWNILEGRYCYSGAADCKRTGFINPVAEYSHVVGCSITGGYVYRGKKIPSLKGVYLYGDYCSGQILGLFATAKKGGYRSRLIINTSQNIASFGEGADGELYVVGLGGKIFKIVKKL